MARKRNNGMNLSHTWFVEQPVDFEHKQYVLLDYIQKADAAFNEYNLRDYFYETRYHAKNLECFTAVRSLLEIRDVPNPTQDQRDYFKGITARPDDDPDLVEAMRIAKWAQKKLQGTVKRGTEVFKKIEQSLKMYFIGKIHDKNTGYLMVRYANADTFECYKFIYDFTFKDATFSFYTNYRMSNDADFTDVKLRVLEDENKSDDLFIAVESEISFNTKKSLFPVLNHLFATKIFNRNILGLPY
jgi:hypothetical protein